MCQMMLINCKLGLFQTAVDSMNLFLFGIFLTYVCAVKQPLNDFIGHYEGLSYNTQTVHKSHMRARRSATSTEVRLNFLAHGREFKLRLRRDTSTFDPVAESIQPDGSLAPLDVSHIYQGELEGDPSSYVHGSIIDGIFSGRIDASDHTYYVDKSEIYFKDIQPFHSVIYSSHDVVDSPRRMKRSTEKPKCGLSDSDIHKWMESVQNSAVDSRPPPPRRKKSDILEESEGRHRHNRYTHRANSHRQSRATSSTGNNNRMCALFLQSDPMLWDYMTRSPSEKTGGLGYTSERAREEITSLFASHVDGIKKIYTNTVFKYQDVGPYKGFTFAVHRVQINTSVECSSHNDNPFCKPNVDVSNFLNLNSLSNHDLYCLAYVFTYRDFSQGTLGLAWVGSYLRASGGLCERWKQYNENNRMIYKSLNTGIVTLVNYGSRVPPKVSTLTFAHEVGHNFGSPHDSGDMCVPSQNNPNNPSGNFIMFASATSGDKPNNHNFSVCSIGNITLVLDAVLNEQNGKDNCFTQNQEAFCGNRIVEGTEQCDCGFANDCHDPDHPDHCCYEQESPKHCQHHENASCSPSEGPCCISHSCSFVDGSDREMCLQEKECSEASYCRGNSAKCPQPTPKPDLSLCNSKTQICRNGDCTGSVCEKVNWKMCSIKAPPEEKGFDRGQLCYVSCLNEVTQQCVSTGNMADVNKEENKALKDLLKTISLSEVGIQMPAGAPCDNYRGYCDVFQKCRAVNEDGPLARLKNLLFNQKTINEIKDWITEHWWAVALMGLGLIIVMGLFIKCCAVHTPSSNPNQPPARKLTLPRRHTQRPQGQGPIGPPPPYTPTAGPSRVTGGPPQGKRQSRSTPKSGPSSSRQPRNSRHSYTRPGYGDFEMSPHQNHL